MATFSENQSVAGHRSSAAAVIVLVFLATAGAVLVLISISTYGNGTGWDGAQYIRHARAFLGEGRMDILYWPPGYPFLLSVLSLVFATDPYTLSGPLNAITFGGIAVMTGLLLLRWTRLPLVAVGLCVLWLTIGSVALLDTAMQVYTEPLFVLSLLFFFLMADRYRTSGRNADLLLMALLAVIAIGLRYMGVAVLLAGIAVILVRDATWRTRLQSGMIFGAAAGIPLLLWLLHNLQKHASLYGERGISQYSVWENITSAQHWVYRWFVPGRVAEILEVLVPVVLLIGVVFAVMRMRKKRETLAASPLSIPLLFSVSYLAIVIAISSITAQDPLADRFLLPLQIPLAIVVVHLLNEGIRRIHPGHLRMLTVAATCIYAAVWIGHQLLRNAEKTMDRMENGAGGNAHVLIRESKLIAWLLRNDSLITESTYSNAPDVLYMEFGTWVRMFPQRVHYRSETESISAAGFAQMWKGVKDATVIWFDPYHRSFLYSVDDLARVAHVQPIKEFPDGSVYRVMARTLEGEEY